MTLQTEATSIGRVTGRREKKEDRLQTFEEGTGSNKIEAEGVKNNDDETINSRFCPTMWIGRRGARRLRDIRAITVIGKLRSSEKKPLGEHEYAYYVYHRQRPDYPPFPHLQHPTFNAQTNERRRPFYHKISVGHCKTLYAVVGPI